MLGVGPGRLAPAFAGELALPGLGGVAVGVEVCPAVLHY